MEDEEFRGFPDDDTVKKSLEDKLARLKMLSKPSSEKKDGRVGGSPQKPTFNRFLKPTVNVNVKQQSAAVKVEVEMKVDVIKKPIVAVTSSTPTPGVVSTKPVIKPFPTKQVDEDVKTEEVPAKRIRKPSYKVLDSAPETPRSRKSSGEDIKAPAPMKTLKIETVVAATQQNVKEVQMKATVKPVPAQLPILEVTQIIGTKIAAAIKEGPQVPLLGNKSLEKSKEVAATKQPLPAKRTASTSGELSFLSGQSVRSKRTIVPNKRFLSADSPPHVPAVIEPVPSTIVKSRKSVPTANTVKVPVVSSKQRSVSGDSVKPSLKRRYSSGQKVSNGNTLVPLVSEAPSNGDQLARPRRVIIPNRKFFDEEESVAKGDALKKTLEEKPKRRKSDKTSFQSDVTGDGFAKQKAQTVNTNSNTLAQTNGTKIPATVAEAGAAKGKPISEVNGRKVTDPPVAQVQPMTQKEVVKEIPKTTVQQTNVNDEMPIGNGEAQLYSSNPLFLGACILKESDQKDGHEGGVICCGVCKRVKKYRRIDDKRKRGSFMCTECQNIAYKIFQLALKCKPFSCIRGPPVCEGSCSLNFQPPEQFCQACFAKSCMKNLPIKDDIYFKLWRAIPPISRGTISTTPVPNPSSPNIGKVVFVDKCGVISATSSSLKIKMKSSDGTATITCLEDSEDGVQNGNGDQDSARLTKFPSRPGTSVICENTSPESHLVTQNQHQELKSNGVKEEIVLTRQIDEKRVTVPTIDTVYKSDLDHIDIFGFPVVVSGPSYPRKPLCFLCGSAGIEQLIYCSCCCEPYHPYCAGDDLLLNTYLANCKYGDSQSQINDNMSGEDDLIQTRKMDARRNSNEVDMRRLAVKWTCRRCLSCKSCGNSFGRRDMIRCIRCQNPYHVDSCIDKLIVAKVKDLSRLKKAWTCDDCMKCRSCGKRIEYTRRVQTIQEVVAHDSDASEDEGEDDRDQNSHINCLMLCKDCFKQRKKGSYCPLCEVCYDDNDWDSKMMECVRCERWIHATCEKLTEDQYNILGKLPDYIEYCCTLCHASSVPPLWFDAVQCQLGKELNTVIRKFEQKSWSSMNRKRSSTDVKPSYVCKLFEDIADHIIQPSMEHKTDNVEEVNDTVQEAENNFVSSLSFEKLDTSIVKKGSQPDKKGKWVRTLQGHDKLRAVSCKEMMSCRVYVRDFLLQPRTLLENLYASKNKEVEPEVDSLSERMQGQAPSEAIKTPIHNETPRKSVSPTRKYISEVASAMKNIVDNVSSVHSFFEAFLNTIHNYCGGEMEESKLVNYAKQAIEDVYPLFDGRCIESKESLGRVDPKIETNMDEDYPSSPVVALIDPFQEEYWNPMDFYDDRICSLCGEMGDFPPEKSGRLLWCGLNDWIHVNCAIWSSVVWEKENGALQDIGSALHRGKTQRCKICSERGATVSCCRASCKNNYHFQCAVDANCFLHEDKTTFCWFHEKIPETQAEIQENMSVCRKVFVDLDWIQKRGLKASSEGLKVFIGSLRVENLGQITPISVEAKPGCRETSTILIPNDFSVERLFWDLSQPMVKECYKFKSVVDAAGITVKTHDPGVNIVIDHSKRYDVIKQGLECVRKFHQWAVVAPVYIDEDLVDWLPECPRDEFVLPDERDVNVAVSETVSHSEQRSPTSTSSSHSAKEKDGRRSPYALRSGRGNDSESGYTEGYASSMDSARYGSTPKSSKVTKVLKRRRSTNRFRKKNTRLSLREVVESPRRRSLRNRHSQGKVCENAWELTKSYHTKEENDSDNDSGVTAGTSSSAEFSEVKTCRINLLSQFCETFEDDEKHFPIDMVSTTPPVNFEASTNIPDENATCGRKLFEDSNGQVCKASLKFQVLKGKSVISDVCAPPQAWMSVFDRVNNARIAANMKPLAYPGLDMKFEGDENEMASSLRVLGLYHRSVQYLLEQLPGVVSVLNRHHFQYSHKPYMDQLDENQVCPVNSKGSARSEGYQGRKPVDMFGWLASRHRKVNLSCNLREESSRAQGLPMAMQYRDLREKARRRFVVMYSEIHGRGLFARCDVEKGEMLIEYAGEVIRPSLTDPREKYYESKGIGCYMFRIKTKVIDATMKGNAARFINHSCEPNCEARTVNILGNDHIIIFALRKIFKGEELTYDYKFEREEDKIPCTCGASRCRKYMN